MANKKKCLPLTVITCVFIFLIYRFYTDFSLFRQIKRQDTVVQVMQDSFGFFFCSVQFTQVSLYFNKNYRCLLNMMLDKENNRIGGVMISVLALIAVDHGFKPQSGQTKD
jgi:hypothetical protein